MDRDPTFEAAWRLDAGHPGEALEVLRGADPLDAQVAMLRARALSDMGRTGEAEEEARRGLELEPDNLALLEMLAATQLARDPDAAAETVRRALALDPENERLLGLRVIVLVQQDRYEWAEQVLSRLMAIAPDAEVTRRVRTLFMLSAAGSAEAMAAARELLRENPDDAYAHYLQALAMMDGRWWRALRHLREAAALRPQDPLLVETARVMHAWYAWPLHLTSRAVRIVIAVAMFAAMIYFMAVDPDHLWSAILATFAFIVCRFTLAFAVRAILQRRITRALRQMYG